MKSMLAVRQSFRNTCIAMDLPDFLAAVDIVHEFLLAGEGIS